MKFNFPSNTQVESVNLRIKVTTGNKIRAIAKERNIPITEVYQTLIEEAIEDYRALYPEKTKEVTAKKVYSVKRDLYEAGDNKREPTEDFDGGGDQRTKEVKDTMLASGGWAVGYSECVSCHTTERKHVARGYCSKCYYQEKAKGNPYPGFSKEKEKKPNCKECGTNEILYPRFGLCSSCYHQIKTSGKTPEKLPKGWYKKEVIEAQLPKKEPIVIEGTPDEQVSPLAEESEIEHDADIEQENEAEFFNTPPSVTLPEEKQKSSEPGAKSKAWAYGSYNAPESITEFFYCANPNCSKPYGGKFVAGTGETRGGLHFCKWQCADAVMPDRKPYPQNFTGEEI